MLNATDVPLINNLTHTRLRMVLISKLYNKFASVQKLK